MKKILVFLLVTIPIGLKAQYMDFWAGKLNFGMEVTIEFNVTYYGFNPNFITLDCPEQYTWDLPCKLIKWSLDSFNIEIPAAGAKFYGQKQHHDSIAVGVWEQNGFPIPLTLNRSLQGIEPVRPQNPELNPDYIVEDVIIQNTIDNVELFGTLTIPKNRQMKACAIMVSGSGKQDKDETIMGHKPFWVIADFLTRNGIAVLRFDDRGSYRSSGNFETSTVYDFANDVRAAIDLARERTGLGENKMGLIGHSEGSMVSQIVLKDRELGFFISLAGPAAPVKELMYQQNKDLTEYFDIKPKEFDKVVGPFLKKVLAIAGDAKLDSLTALNKILKLYEKNKNKFSDAAKNRFGMENPEAAAEWLHKPMRVFLGYIPEANIKLIKIPILAMNGTLDKQVYYEPNIKIFKKYLKNNSLSEIHVLEGKNHLFQTAQNGSIAEYGKLEETFSPDALAIMKDWLNKIFPN